MSVLGTVGHMKASGSKAKSKSQKWQGEERRKLSEDHKEYLRALRKRAKRKLDRQMKALHYITMITLFLILFSSYMVAIWLNFKG